MGGPGEESGTGEAQGTQLGAMASGEQSTGGATVERSHIGFGRIFHSLNTSGAERRRGTHLYATPRSLSQRETGLRGGQWSGKRFRVRYRQRVKDYIDAIANTEK